MLRRWSFAMVESSRVVDSSTTLRDARSWRGGRLLPVLREQQPQRIDQAHAVHAIGLGAPGPRGEPGPQLMLGTGPRAPTRRRGSLPSPARHQASACAP